MSISYADDNVIRQFTMNDLKGEYIINQDHLYTIVHSRIFDCDPHTKVKYDDADIMSKQFGDTFVVFIPTTAKTPIEIPKCGKCILDVRSCELKGKDVFAIFTNFISDFSVNATSAFGEKGTIYMTPSTISDNKISEKPNTLKGIKVTVILDRYSFCELDEYCSMLLAYFYKHYEVKGTPHKLYKHIFKPIRIGEAGNKVNIAVPVLKLQ